jgi:hypothetical protein
VPRKANNYGKRKEGIDEQLESACRMSEKPNECLSHSRAKAGRHNVNQHKKLDHSRNGCVFDVGEWVAQHHEGGDE